MGGTGDNEEREHIRSLRFRNVREGVTLRRVILRRVGRREPSDEAVRPCHVDGRVGGVTWSDPAQPPHPARHTRPPWPRPARPVLPSLPRSLVTVANATQAGKACTRGSGKFRELRKSWAESIDPVRIAGASALAVRLQICKPFAALQAQRHWATQDPKSIVLTPAFATRIWSKSPTNDFWELELACSFARPRTRIPFRCRNRIARASGWFGHASPKSLLTELTGWLVCVVGV